VSRAGIGRPGTLCVGAAGRSAAVCCVTAGIFREVKYWAYEYADPNKEIGALKFDSYMVPEDEFEFGEYTHSVVMTP